MRCPRCGELSTEGAAICDGCDEILDPAFFERYAEAEDSVSGERTDIGPAPGAETPRRRSLAASPPAITARSARFRGGWNSGLKEPEPPRERRPYLAPPPAAPPPTALDEARRSADDLTSFFRSLSPADRWAAGAAVALLASLALPWRWTRADDEVIGLFAAWPLALLGGGVTALVYWRARRADAAQSQTLQLGQLAAAAFSALFASGFVYLTNESRALSAAGKAVSVALSTPLFGAWAGLGCAVIALVASAAAFAERR